MSIYIIWICIYIYAYICLYVSRRNDSNDKKMEGTKIFYHKVVTPYNNNNTNNKEQLPWSFQYTFTTNLHPLSNNTIPLHGWASWWLSGKEPTRQCRWSSAMQEAWVWSLVQEGPLEKEMATHSNILAWEISWTEEPGWIQFTGSQKTWIRLSDWAPTHFMLSVNVVVLFRH